MRNARRIIKIEYAKTASFDMGNKIIVDWMEENDKFSVLGQDGNGDVEFSRDELWELVDILEENNDHETANAIRTDIGELDVHNHYITYSIF